MKISLSRLDLFSSGLTDGKLISLILFLGVFTGLVGALQWYFTVYFYDLSIDFLVGEDLRPGRLEETFAFILTILHSTALGSFIFMDHGKARKRVLAFANITLIPTYLIIIPGFMVWLDVATAMSVSVTLAATVFVIYVPLNILEKASKND